MAAVPTETAPPDCAEQAARMEVNDPRKIGDLTGLTHLRSVFPKSTAEDRGALSSQE